MGSRRGAWFYRWALVLDWVCRFIRLFPARFTRPLRFMSCSLVTEGHGEDGAL